MRQTFPLSTNATLAKTLMTAWLGSHLLMPAFAQSTRPVDNRSTSIFYCKSRDFNLPFNVSSIGRTPSELELEVSMDGGNVWQVAERARADARSFRYQASADGLYQFRLQLIDSNGRRVPASDAPIQIMIDSQSPLGELSVDVNPQGELVASFIVNESFLSYDSLKLEYRTEHDDRWIKVDTSLQQGNDPSEIHGSGLWDVPFGTHQLVVRLIAKDLAGNELETFRYPQLPRTANALQSMQLASQRQEERPPIGASPLGNPRWNGSQANSKPNAATTLPPNGNGSLPTGNLVRKVNGANVPTLAGPEMPFPVPALPRANAQLGYGSVLSGPPNALTYPDANRQTDETLPAPPASSSNPPANDPVNGNSGAGLAFELPPVEGSPSTSAMNPANGNAPSGPGATSFAFKDAPTESGTLVEPAQHPLGIEPFYSNSRTLSLDYDLVSNPAIGIQAIELWGSTDQGKTWENWGADPDRLSPMDVAVEEDGTFGFRIVTISDNGVATNRPVAGDPADVWIEIDSQAPGVQILTAQYGRGTEAGSLVIEYQASDTYMNDRPISLSISETSTGPWTTVTTGQANTGRLVWLAQPGLPKQVYLRLEALDRAGNLGEHRFELPIDISALSPRGKIQGIRPIRVQPQ